MRTEGRTLKAATSIQPIASARKLRAEDIESLPIAIRIQDGSLILEKGLRGQRLREAVKIPLDKVLAAGEKGLVAYIMSAFASERPKLLPLVFDNQSLIKMARHFLRHCSGSLSSLYSYVDTVSRYSLWLGYSPDAIIEDLKPAGNIADPQRAQNHGGYLEQYLAELQDEGLTPGRVHNVIKQIRTFYRVNGAEVKLAEPLRNRITYKV